jgi:membrane-bound lytic murein transglycosylase F
MLNNLSVGRSVVTRGRDSAAGGEEGLEKEGGFLGKDAGNNFYAMVKPRVRENFEARADRAAAGIVSAVNQFGDASLNHRAGAHRAGLERDVEGRAGKAVVGQSVGGFAEDDDFRVSRGVIVADGAIAGASKNLVIVYEDGADRDFSGAGGGAGLFDGELHVVEVGKHAKKEE